MVLGNAFQRVCKFSSTGLSPSTACLSRAFRVTCRFVTRREACRPLRKRPTTPDLQRRQALTQTGFRLLPFRSPLLRESLLFSFPGGTEMFQFPPLAFCQRQNIPLLSGMGYPIRRSPDQRLLAPPRGLSQLATSFIASVCLGIHRLPLVS